MPKLLSDILGGFGNQGFVGASVYSTAGQSIPDATTTVVTLGSTFYSNKVTANGTGVTIVESGYYHIAARLRYATGGAGRRAIRLYVNTSNISINEQHGDASTFSALDTSRTVFLNAGDTVEIRAFQASGAALTLRNAAEDDYPILQVYKLQSALPEPIQEGTWTPTLTTNGTDFSSVTYNSLTAGWYKKTGKIVQLEGIMRTDSVTIGSASSSVVIGGLPFTIKASDANYRAPFAVGYHNGWGTDPSNVPSTMMGSGNTNFIFVYEQSQTTGGLSTIDVADVSTGTNDIRFSGYYQTDD